jgi:Carboxypeptidase regulatory-like domain/TonB dependent receptor
MSGTAAARQSTATLEGRVVDPSGAVVPGATVSLSAPLMGLTRIAKTDSAGVYELVALPVGTYRLEAVSARFSTVVVEALALDVGRTVLKEIVLPLSPIVETVIIRTPPDVLRLPSLSSGDVVDGRAIRDMPLNGRHFYDLTLLGDRAVTPPQSGVMTQPLRGMGSVGFNASGNREDSVNAMVNGVSVAGINNNSITVQPSIDSLDQFRIDSSAFSAEYGHTAGSVVQVVTRSGTNTTGGRAFFSLRDDALDARNVFELEKGEFHRRQFGGHIGGPIVKDRAFFFATYEGLQQQQHLPINSLVLTDAQRSAVTDPVVAGLIDLIPRANVVDARGVARYVGGADAPLDTHQWTGDLRLQQARGSAWHGYYALQLNDMVEPTRMGNTVPGFGDIRTRRHQVLSVERTVVLGTNTVNDTRAGFNRFLLDITPRSALNPIDFGILNGIERPIGLPQISVAGGLNFGGPSIVPSRRIDTTAIVANTMSHILGRHSVRWGGEFRHSVSDNSVSGSGTFNFDSIDSFLAGRANAFSVTVGDRRSRITQPALGLFIQDSLRLHPTLTVEPGLRYEWNFTPTEADDRLVVFDPDTARLLRVGHDIEAIFDQNNLNFEPRLGVTWIPDGGSTVVRGAYGLHVDQLTTNMLAGPASNPPLAQPLSYTGQVSLASAITRAGPVGLSPQSIDHDYRNASMRSWNVNIQKEVPGQIGVMAGYFGSAGRNLRLTRNLNQPDGGVRPYAAVSLDSPILPGVPLGNISQVESSGWSRYDALTVTARRRQAAGMRFAGSYTWSKSLDYNSLNIVSIVAQDSRNPHHDRALSDFDARHRFVLSATYELPFREHTFGSGWLLAALVQLQSGNPVSIVTSSSTVNGLPNTVRPDLVAPIQMTGSTAEWFETSSFAAVPRFGNLGRNVVIGPGFQNIDVSLVKVTRTGSRGAIQIRIDVFNVLNHPSLGQPGRVVGTPTFGVITSTRFPTGESGASRQIQLGMQLQF